MTKRYFLNKTIVSQSALGVAILASSFSLAASLSAQNFESSEIGTLAHPGFVITGVDESAYSGLSVSGAGDVNGDSYADLIVSSPGANSRTGECHVIFGKSDIFEVNLSALGTGGFQIIGANSQDTSGFSVSGAGDVNGDGLDDLIIGAPFFSPNSNQTNAGESYVVFGKADLLPVSLSNLGTGGFRINGENPNNDPNGQTNNSVDDRLGISVSGAGDVNGDGLADVIVGASRAGEVRGESYIVFGKTDSTNVNINNLGSGGFRLLGIEIGDLSGRSVSGAGDVNGDGFGDFVIGALGASPRNQDNSGESYVVFGRTNFDLVDLNNLGNGGFRIDGAVSNDASGEKVSSAGDVNGDGLGDLIIAARSIAPLNNEDVGKSYVVFGKKTGTTVSLANLGTGGFRIIGTNNSYDSELAISGAGDINGDGFADILISDSRADKGNIEDVGAVYIVYGKPTSSDVVLNNLGTSGFRIDGSGEYDFFGDSVSSAGDVNADGITDLIMSDTTGINSHLQEFPGKSFVLFSSPVVPISATYLASAKAGDAPNLAVGICGDGSNNSSPDSRSWIDFDSGDQASIQRVTLTRSNSGISNLPNVAPVIWEVETDRTGWESATVTFKYTDAEILGFEESGLFLYKAPTPSGPWTHVTNQAHDFDRNIISSTVSPSELDFFAISNFSLSVNISTIPNGRESSPSSILVAFSEPVSNFDSSEVRLTSSNPGSSLIFSPTVSSTGNPGEFSISSLAVNQAAGTIETWTFSILPGDIVGENSGQALPIPVSREFTIAVDSVATQTERIAGDNDGNDDGVADSNQGNVASKNLGNGTVLTVVSPEGTVISNLLTGAPTQNVPDGIAFPEGVLDLEISGGPVGGTIPVDIIYTSPRATGYVDFFEAEEGTYILFSPTAVIDDNLTSSTVHLILSDD